MVSESVMNFWLTLSFKIVGPGEDGEGIGEPLFFCEEIERRLSNADE